MLKASCPTCGAGLEFVNKASLYAVCSHCGVASVREEMNLKTLGKVAELQDDHTPIQIGTRGVCDGRGFTVMGRRQMSYERGFWNEWFLQFDSGDPGWLGEAMGLYSVLTQIRAAVPAFNAARLGQQVDLEGVSYWVKNVLKGECAAAEGELPFAIACPYPSPSIDLLGADRRCATLDYGGPNARVFVGAYRDFNELKFIHLRPLEGW